MITDGDIAWALSKARELWGANATVSVEKRLTADGWSILCSVGTTGDTFNWTSRGQGATFEEAFKEAEAPPYRRARR